MRIDVTRRVAAPAEACPDAIEGIRSAMPASAAHRHGRGCRWRAAVILSVMTIASDVGVQGFAAERGKGVPAYPPCFAHESRIVTVRLNTGRAAEWSARSATK